MKKYQDCQGKIYTVLLYAVHTVMEEPLVICVDEEGKGHAVPYATFYSFLPSGSRRYTLVEKVEEEDVEGGSWLADTLEENHLI